MRGYWRVLVGASMAEWFVLEIFQDGADKSFAVCAKIALMALLFMASFRGRWVSGSGVPAGAHKPGYILLWLTTVRIY